MKKLAAALLLLSMLLLAACGGEIAPVSPTPEVTPTPVPTPTPEYIERPTLSEPSGVFTDWSKLTEYVAPQTKYTRLSPEPLTELTPGDYGLLLPFEGERKFVEDYGWAAGSKYGLVTADGCIVLDAVCDNIRQGDWWTNGQAEYLDFYILERVEYDPNDPRANEYNGGYYSTYAACALDGSWYTGFRYNGIYVMPEGFAGIVDGMNNLVECYDLEGRLLFNTADWPVLDSLAEWGVYTISMLGSETKWVNVTLENGDDWEYAFVNAKGEVLRTEGGSRFERAQAFSEGLAAVCVDGMWGYIDEQGAWAITPSYPMGFELSAFKNGRALVSSDRRSLLIDRSGKVLASTEESVWAVEAGEHIVYCSYDTGMEYFDENLQPILIDGKMPTSYGGGGFWREQGNDIILLKFDGTKLYFPSARYVDYAYGYYISGDDNDVRKVYDADGKLIFDIGKEMGWTYLKQDSLTGEIYVCVDKGGSYSVYSIDGEKLLTGCVGGMPVGGLFQCSDSTTVGYKNTQNEWVFRIRLDVGD